MTVTTWLVVAAIAINLAATVRTLVLSRRHGRELDTILKDFNERAENFNDRVEGLMLAVAFCAALAEDELVPDAIRIAARAAIPKDVRITITHEPPVSGDPPRVH
jgi:hypothetical protein